MTTTTTLNAKATAVKTSFTDAALNFANAKLEALSKVESAQSQEEKNAFAATANTAQTHERYTEALSNMSEKALTLLAKYKVSADDLSKQSRELKKRSIAILEALATSQHVNDRALDAVLQFIAHKDAASMTLEQVRHEMQHETTTQAQYFKTCAIFFNFATYSKADKMLSFNKENAVFRDLMKIYAKADAVAV